MTQDILDALTAQIAILNNDGVIVEANRAWLRYVSARSNGRLLGIGAHYRDGWDDEHGLFAPGAHDVLQGIEHVLHGTTHAFVSEYPQHSDNSARWFRLEATSLRQGGALLTHTDITSQAASARMADALMHNQQLRDRLRRRKRMTRGMRQSYRLLEEQSTRLTQLNTELQQFVSVASHELREPLQMVVSFLNLLRQRYEEQLDEQADEYIGYASDGARRMQRMIDKLLDYARLEHSTRELRPVSTDDALARAIAVLQEQMTESQALVTYDEMPMVLGDDVEISLIFRNLLSNAIKFSGAERPRIHIGAQHQGNEWLLSVRDHGVGVAPADTGRIFDIFVRAYSRSEFPGSGIGLAICRKIVTRHGGRIWVENPMDGGARFCFTLPAA